MTSLVIRRVIAPAIYSPYPHVTKQVFALYRSKLRVASKMGYKIGSGADKNFIDPSMFDDNKITNYARKFYVGDMTWSHIYYTYRQTIKEIEKDYEYNEEIYNQALDYGFETLRAYNKMKNVYDDENKYKEQAIAAKYGKGNPLMPLPKGSIVWDYPSG